VNLADYKEGLCSTAHTTAIVIYGKGLCPTSAWLRWLLEGKAALFVWAVQLVMNLRPF